MMKKQIALATLALALTSAPAFSNDAVSAHSGTSAPNALTNSTHLNVIIDHSRKVQFEATEMRNLLNTKSPNLALVAEKLDLLARHNNEMVQEIADFEASHHGLTPVQKQELQNMKNVSAIIGAFVTGKKTLMAAEDASRKTKLLRAKADGIAKRAELVEKSALRIRS